jgi:hypothetical protein
LATHNLVGRTLAVSDKLELLEPDKLMRGTEDFVAPLLRLVDCPVR